MNECITRSREILWQSEFQFYKVYLNNGDLFPIKADKNNHEVLDSDAVLDLGTERD